jgi:transcriptional regulator with XRE-family HTH domain
MPSVRYRRIGSALRQAREAAGLTIEAAARRYGRSPGWISTTENGLQPIRVDDLADLLDFYRVQDPTLRESLLHLARQGRKKNWEREFEGKISAAALDLASLEADSGEVRSYQPLLVPGLLQNEDYTRAIMAAGLPRLANNAEPLIAFRMARKAVFAREDPPVYRAVIGEGVLHHQVGGSTVMRKQLAHMAAMIREHRVAMHVIPYSAGANFWVSVPFNLFSLRPPGRLTIAVVEEVTQSTFIEDEEKVAEHEEIFDHLLTAALDETSSLEVIEQLMSRS